MMILALELSSDCRSVALLDTSMQKVCVAREQGQRHTHVFALIEQVLEESGAPRESIQKIAVGVGPGSYTGIRMAISLSQGWSLALGTPLQAISSMDCLVEGVKSQGVTGDVSVIVDAQRGEFYLADYSISADGWQVVSPLEIAAKSIVEERIKQGRKIVGPEAPKHFNGAMEFYPDACHLARLAASACQTTPPEQMEPVYLRPISYVKAPPSRIINPDNSL